MSPAKRTKFPKTIRKGSVSVTVYEGKNKAAKSGIGYSVAWYGEGGGRKVLRYTTPEKAIEEAEKQAKELSANKQDAELIKWRHKEAYVKAQEIVVDTPLITVAKEWKRAFDLTGGNIVPAAQAWKNHHGAVEKVYTANEIAQRFQKAKAEAGINIKASYARTLPAFLKVFGKKFITTITARSLQKWLNDTHFNPVTRNTHRKRIVTLWTWARKQGYLPRNIQHEAELTELAEEPVNKREIISHQVFRKLLDLIQERHPHYIAPLVLAGFCGMRRDEVHHQLWEDIDLEDGDVSVTKAKKGTAGDRDLPLCGAAVEWLLLSPNKSGLVCSNMAIDQIRKIGRQAGLELPENCFRHTFVSCRIIVTGSKAKTALEAGNSERVIDKHYRKKVKRPEAEAWFAIRPKNIERKVVGFEEA